MTHLFPALRKFSIAIIGISALSNPEFSYGQTAGETVKDADGNRYHTVKIGNQLWLKENLKAQSFRNGDKILSMPISTDWSNFTKPAVSEKPKNGPYDSHYGKLYNWYTVSDPRGLCPIGYRIPKRKDIEILLDELGRNKSKWSDKSIFSQGEAENLGGKLKAKSKLWLAPNSGANNQSGFNALPAGYRARSIVDMGLSAWFWTSTEYDALNADGIVLSNESSGAKLTYHFKTNGFSVRCLKD
jgi:uncharacterized protein (TIGR02145 family)